MNMDWLKYVSPLAGFLEKPKNPMDAAMPYLNQQEDLFSGQFNPYAPQGMQDQGGLGQQYYQMGTNPVDYQNQIMGGYQESPWFQNQLSEGLKAAGGVSAAGGMSGTTSDIMGQGKLAAALKQQDMKDWYERVMGIQGQGMQGQENMLGNLGNVYGSKAGLGYEGSRQKTQWENDKFNNYLNMLMKGVGMATGGAPGAAGGAAGAKFF